jgi:hypothetical protein
MTRPVKLRTLFRIAVSVGLVLASAACGPRAAPVDETPELRGADLLAGGRAVVIRDAVPGDVIVAGGSIEFSGSAGGDYLGAGGQQQIAGRVAGSVRAAGGEVWLRAPVERNATLAGGRIEHGREGEIAGNVYLVGGEVQVLGSVDGFLHATGGTVVLDGGVGDDVRLQAGRLHVGPSARIGGFLRYSVEPDNVTIDPGAEIAGQVIALPPPKRPAFWALRIAWHFGFLVAGAVAVALLPALVAAASQALRRRPWAAVGFGLLWIIGVPILAGVLANTVVGIPLALIAVALYVISLYLARAVIRAVARAPVARRPRAAGAGWARAQLPARWLGSGRRGAGAGGGRSRQHRRDTGRPGCGGVAARSPFSRTRIGRLPRLGSRRSARPGRLTASGIWACSSCPLLPPRRG